MDSPSDIQTRDRLDSGRGTLPTTALIDRARALSCWLQLQWAARRTQHRSPGIRCMQRKSKWPHLRGSGRGRQIVAIATNYLSCETDVRPVFFKQTRAFVIFNVPIFTLYKAMGHGVGKVGAMYLIWRNVFLDVCLSVFLIVCKDAPRRLMHRFRCAFFFV